MTVDTARHNCQRRVNALQHCRGGDRGRTGNRWYAKPVPCQLGHTPIVYYVEMGYSNPDKQREYVRNWMARRRREWINDDGPCAACGSTVELEVDHIDPTRKTMHPASIWSRNKATREAELSLCQVLCRQCHREKTNRQLATAEHGTHSRYTGGKCRCCQCKEAHRVSMREWRSRDRAI